MAVDSNNTYNYNSMETETTQMQNLSQNCDWFCSETGNYRSKHRSMELPTDPFLDVVSFIFFHAQQGVTALIDSPSGSSISYRKLQEMVKSVASGLQEIGISQGQVVLMLLPNSIYFPVIYLGVLSVGAVVTTMNPLSSLREINKQVNDSKVVLAFTVSGSLEKIENMGVRGIAVPENIEFDLGSSEFSSFNRLLLRKPEFARKPIIKQQDTATLLYSSGTSGASKGVVLSHENLIAMVQLFVRFDASQYGSDAWENVYLAVLPMFHVYGLSLFVSGLLSLGSKIVVMRRFSEKEMVRTIERYRVTHFPVAPPILGALTRVKGGYDLGSLKQVSSGGAPLSKRVMLEFLQKFPHVDFIQGYGMTESTAVGTRGFNSKNVHKHTSVGLLAPNMEAKVVDLNTGSCLPPGKGGELWLRGPGIMKGYLNNEDATAAAIDKEGWYHTGDVVKFDQDGFLYILERLKDIIKYKGFQVAPADLESVLISHPEIIDVAVTGAPDDDAGEIPVAFLVKRPGSRLSPADVINYVSKQVAPYKKIRKVFFVKSIPRSAAGKILRRQLRNFMTSRM